MKALNIKWALLLLPLLLLAGTLRVHYIDENNFIAERQYRSALIARALYFDQTGHGEETHREIAQVSAERMGLLEPPIMEALAAMVYRLAGRDDPRLVRLLAIAFWMAGGVLLWLLASRFTGAFGSLAATAYFLFLPLGVKASAAFLPESLMVMLFVAALWGIVRYEESPSFARLILASLFSAAAIAVKPLTLFGLVGAFAFLRISQHGFRGLFSAPALTFALIGVAAPLSYYLYGVLFGGFLRGQAGGSIVPELLLQAAFWKQTLFTIVSAFGITGILLAAGGLAIARATRFNPLLLGLVAGHVALIATFTHHVRFADYYHLPLLIPLAIWIGCALHVLWERVVHLAAPLLRWSVILLALVLLAAVVYREVHYTISRQGPLVDRDIARHIGEVVQHSDRVVYVSQYYGTPLEYYGRLSGWYWPRAGEDRERALHGADARHRGVQERLQTLGSAPARAEPDFVPEYFVVTDFGEYRHHGDLGDFLTERCRLIEEGPGYLIFGQCDLGLPG